MTTYGPFGFATATTDGSDDFLYTNTQGGPSQNGDTLPATSGNLQLWWNDNDTTSSGVGPESGQEGDPEGYLHIEASDTGTGWDDTYDIEFDTTLDCSTEQFQFNFYTSQRGDDNDVTCQIQINKNGAGWIDVGAEFGGSGDPTKEATNTTPSLWTSRSVDLSDGGTHTDASTRVRILLTMPSDTGGLSWHNDYGIDTIEIVGTPLLSNEVKGATFSHNSTSALGSASVSLWLDNGNDTITFKSQITSDSTDGSFIFTGVSSASTRHFITATLVSGSSNLMDISERTITPSSTYGGSVDLYLRSQVDKSETAGDGDLRLRGQGDKGSSGISGNGDLAAQDATISGEGTSQSAGNGDLASAAATISGTGDTVSAGDGDLQAGVATIAGEGTSGWLGNGDLQADAATIAGTGISTSEGDGDLQSGAAAIAGEGTSQSLGSGDLQASAATIAGEGTRVSGESGNGNLAAGDSAIAGEGETRASGGGDLAAAAATITAEGTVSSAGDGDLVASAAAVAGSGVLVDADIIGGGDLQADVAVIAGEGTSQSAGNGDLAADAAAIAATGVSRSVGNGALQASSAAIEGSGNIIWLGQGDLQVGAASIAGSGVSQSIGGGDLAMSAARIAGSADTGVTAPAGFAKIVIRRASQMRARKRRTA